jgi:hypothetical protein
MSNALASSLVSESSLLSRFSFASSSVSNCPRRFLLTLPEFCFKSPRRKEVCQKLVRSLAMAAEPLAAKN